jgi:hypothetical protein
LRSGSPKVIRVRTAADAAIAVAGCLPQFNLSEV